VSKKTWIIFAAVCVLILGGLVVLSQKDKVDVSNVNQAKLQTASVSSGNIADHVFGLPNSDTSLVEYGDYECPYCGEVYPKLKTVVDNYKTKITFVFRNYPLSSIHPNARAAAAAAEAAGLQGKYWEMHDKLYESQNDWSSLATDKRTDMFVAYAREVGVASLDKFKADMASSAITKKIDYDLALGNKAKITGTPTIYLNGVKLSDDVASNLINGDGSSLKNSIDLALK